MDPRGVVWLIDIATEKLEVYQAPGGGGYQGAHEYGLVDSVAPSAVPDMEVEVRAVFGT